MTYDAETHEILFCWTRMLIVSLQEVKTLMGQGVMKLHASTDHHLCCKAENHLSASYSPFLSPCLKGISTLFKVKQT